MRFFDRFFHFKKAKQKEDLEEELGWEEIAYSRDTINIHNEKERQEYIQSCLEQIAECSAELENLNYEYQNVTSYLKDMEEIEALPLEQKKALEAAAQKVARLQDEKEKYHRRSGKMTDAQFHHMERMSKEVEEGLVKLKEAEEYQELVRKDLGRLDNERNAFRYRRNELIVTLQDTKNIAIICTTAFFACLLILILLQTLLKMDAGWGFILTSGIAGILYLYLFLKYAESKSEMKLLSRDTNRLIQLQNRVKIRYVNNTHLLEYLYMKYQVQSAKELQKLWDSYSTEKEAREAYRRAQLDLDENEQEFMAIIRQYQITDPAIWLHQADAILDHKEMVEIRHELIIRRQSLRKRIEYNKEILAGNAKKEIMELVELYPQYASEIMAMVEKYEGRYH